MTSISDEAIYLPQPLTTERKPLQNCSKLQNEAVHSLRSVTRQISVLGPKGEPRLQLDKSFCAPKVRSNRIPHRRLRRFPPVGAGGDAGVLWRKSVPWCSRPMTVDEGQNFRQKVCDEDDLFTSGQSNRSGHRQNRLMINVLSRACCCIAVACPARPSRCPVGHASRRTYSVNSTGLDVIRGL